MNIYLNNASTTPIKQEVLDVIMDTLKHNWHNPNDISDKGMEAKRLLEKARETVAKSINAEPEEILFMSSGSAANALAMKYCNWNERVLTTTIEHGSIMNNKKCMCNIPVNSNGLVNILAMENLIKEFSYICPMISVQYTNNEIGTIQDIKKISEIAHENGLLCHSDAVQYYPYYKVDVKKDNLDLMTISPHKLGCPSGTGALYVKKGVKLNPLIPGSSQQEMGLFAGTENVAYAVGFAKAVELMECYSNDIAKKRNDLWSWIQSALKDKVHLNGLDVSDDRRSCNNLNIRIDGVDNQQLIGMLEMSGVICAAGSACHAYSRSPSYVLTAIGLTPEEANSSIRITLSENTTYQELDYFVKVLQQCVEFLL